MSRLPAKTSGGCFTAPLYDNATPLTSDAEHFRVRATLDEFEGDTRVYTESWDGEIPRNLV